MDCCLQNRPNLAQARDLSGRLSACGSSAGNSHPSQESTYTGTYLILSTLFQMIISVLTSSLSPHFSSLPANSFHHAGTPNTPLRILQASLLLPQLHCAHVQIA